MSKKDMWHPKHPANEAVATKGLLIISVPPSLL
jgi:hypothetical protein